MYKFVMDGIDQAKLHYTEGRSAVGRAMNVLFNQVSINRLGTIKIGHDLLAYRIDQPGGSYYKIFREGVFAYTKVAESPEALINYVVPGMIPLNLYQMDKAVKTALARADIVAPQLV